CGLPARTLPATAICRQKRSARIGAACGRRRADQRLPARQVRSVRVNMPNKILVCGSVAFDTITVFEGHFKDHILPNSIQSLSVSFFVPSMRKEYGGCAGNIAYNLKLLGADPVPVGTVGVDAGDYLEYMRRLGIDTSLVKVLPDTFTPQCFITTDLDSNQIASFHPGAMSRSFENDLSGTKAA